MMFLTDCQKTQIITTMGNISLNSIYIFMKMHTITNEISLCAMGLTYKILFIIVAKFGNLVKTSPYHTSNFIFGNGVGLKLGRCADTCQHVQQKES